MIVHVTVRGASIKISCGNGRQTIRWLGSVVQARIEQYGVLRKSYEQDHYIVTEIRNTDGQLLNPADLICEHAASDTLSVTAIVASSFPVDEWEIPEMGEWLKAATIKSKTGQHWVSEIEAWRESLKTFTAAQNAGEDAEKNILVHKAHPPSSSLIQIGFDFSESEINAAFDLDWTIMKWDWLLPSELLKSQLGDVLKSNYAMVCNLFTHYCGTGQVGQRYGMTMQEFGHLLHYLRVCNLKTSEDLVEDIFSKTSLSGGPTGPGAAAGKWPLMTRAHLAQALVSVALASKAEGSTDAEALRQFFAGKVAALWGKLTSSYVYYTSEDPVIKKSTLEYFQLLKHAFQQRATTDSKFGPRLKVSSFLGILRDASMVEPEQENTCVGCFLEAQFAPSPAWELEDLVLCEFLEALSRVAIRLIEPSKGSTFTDGKRVRMAFNFVAELNDSAEASAAAGAGRGGPGGHK